MNHSAKLPEQQPPCPALSVGPLLRQVWTVAHMRLPAWELPTLGTLNPKPSLLIFSLVIKGLWTLHLPKLATPNPVLSHDCDMVPSLQVGVTEKPHRV